MSKPKPRGVKCPKCSSVVILPQVDTSRVNLQCEPCGHTFAVRLRPTALPSATAANSSSAHSASAKSGTASQATRTAAGTPPVPQPTSPSPSTPLGTAPVPATLQHSPAPPTPPAAPPLGQAPLGAVPVPPVPQLNAPGTDTVPLASSARKAQQVDDFDEKPQGLGIKSEAELVIHAKPRKRSVSRKKQAQNRWLAIALTGAGIAVALGAVGLAILVSGWMSPSPDTMISPLDLAEEIKAADKALVQSYDSLETKDDAEAFVDNIQTAAANAKQFLARAILSRALNEGESDKLTPLKRFAAPSPVKAQQIAGLIADLPAEEQAKLADLQNAAVAHRIAIDYLTKANVDLATPDSEAETIDHDLIEEWRNINRLIAKQILKADKSSNQTTEDQEDRLNAISKIYSPIQSEVRISINQLEKRAAERAQLTADQIFVSHQYHQALTTVQTGFIVLTGEHNLEMKELGLDLAKDFQRALTAVTTARQANAETLANDKKSTTEEADTFDSLNEAIEKPDDEQASAVVNAVKNDPRFDFEKDAGTKNDPVMGEIPK